MEFLYQNQFDENNLKDCPPKIYQNKKLIAYRFIYSEKHPNNFAPQYVKQPKRVLKKQPDNQKCTGFGLSFFDSEENARNFFIDLKEQLGWSDAVANKAIGYFIAEGEICSTDGVSSGIRYDGHFTNHPYKGVDYESG